MLSELVFRRTAEMCNPGGVAGRQDRLGFGVFDAVNRPLLGMSKVVSEDALRRALAKIDEPAGVQWLPMSVRVLRSRIRLRRPSPIWCLKRLSNKRPDLRVRGCRDNGPRCCYSRSETDAGAAQAPLGLEGLKAITGTGVPGVVDPGGDPFAEGKIVVARQIR